MIPTTLGVLLLAPRKPAMLPDNDWPEVRTKATLAAAARLWEFASERAIRIAEYERAWKAKWEADRRRQIMRAVK